MINENTLKSLNRYAFGADVDSLESFIIDCKQASVLADYRKYEDSYMRLSKLFKEIKSESKAFSDSTSIVDEIPIGDFDFIFDEHRNKRLHRVYGNHLENTVDFKNSINNHPEKVVDLVGMVNVLGVDIICTYVYGNLYKIYAVGADSLYLDLTEELGNAAPKRLDGIEKYMMAQLSGVAITNLRNNKHGNCITDTIRCLRCHRNYDSISLVFKNMYIEADDDNIELPYDNQWDKLEYMRGMGLTVPNHGLVRGVYSETVGSAFNALDDFFVKGKSDDSLEAGLDKDGYIIKVNDLTSDEVLEESVIYVSDCIDSQEVFKAKVKGIKLCNGEYGIEQVASIVEHRCNVRCTVDTVFINDIYRVEEQGITVGKTISFRVIDNVAEIFIGN